MQIDGAPSEFFDRATGTLALGPGGRPSDSPYTLMFASVHYTRELDAYPRDRRRLSDSVLAGLVAKVRATEPWPDVGEPAGSIPCAALAAPRPLRE